MIRVVLDTNIVISATLRTGGLPEAVFNLAIHGVIQLCVSEVILAEYEVPCAVTVWVILPANFRSLHVTGFARLATSTMRSNLTPISGSIFSLGTKCARVW